MVRSSFRVVNAKDGELLASAIRTAEVESVRLEFSHDNQVIIPNSNKEDGNQRLEVWIPEEGEDFEVTVYDVMEGLTPDVVSMFPLPTYTRYDISAFCTGIDNAGCVLLDDDYAEVIEGTITTAGKYARFTGDTSSNTKVSFKYVISGAKGFLSIPVVGDNIIVQQTEGSRDINLRLINEGDNV